VPVYKGATDPLIIEPVPKDEVRVSHAGYHGADGFGGATFDVEPDLNITQKQPAVLALIELARKHKGMKYKTKIVNVLSIF
jgi:inosine-uridine nucleoside N-ribohydrolase